jgi:hypothetical protein
MKATINGIIIEMTPAEFLEYNRLAGNEKPPKDYKVSERQKKIFEEGPDLKSKKDFIKRKAFTNRIPHEKKIVRLPEPDRHFGRILREMARRLNRPEFTGSDLERYLKFDPVEIRRIHRHMKKSHAIEIMGNGRFRFYPSVWLEQISQSECNLSKALLRKYFK